MSAIPPSSSLSAVRAHDRVVIRRILFEELRELCAQLDLREGETVRWRAIGTHLFLETPKGRVVSLERDWARFVEVSSESQEVRTGTGALIGRPDLSSNLESLVGK